MKVQAYHGSTKKFSKFETGHKGQSQNAHSDVLFFTDDVQNAKSYAVTRDSQGYIYNVELTIKNPYIVDAQGRSHVEVIEGAIFRGGNWFIPNPANVAPFYLPAPKELQRDPKSINDVIADAKANGHDGVIVKNVCDCGHGMFEQNPQTTFVVFNANQVCIIA
jgi:hypothetical protein